MLGELDPERWSTRSKPAVDSRGWLINAIGNARDTWRGWNGHEPTIMLLSRKYEEMVKQILVDDFFEPWRHYKWIFLDVAETIVTAAGDIK